MFKRWDLISSSSSYDVTWNGEFIPKDEKQEKQAGIIWEQALRKRPDSFVNGLIYTFESANVSGDKTVIHGRRARYFYYYAQHVDPSLDFGLVPVGVSGIIEVPHGNGKALVAAKRGSDVTQYSGFYEFVPSGGIDEASMHENGQVDYTGQLRKELNEETGVGENEIESIRPFAFIRDIEGGVFDICSVITLNSNPFSKGKTSVASNEYSEFVVIPYEEAPQFLKKNKNKVVPTSLAMFQALNKK